jgi:hypothetical protein
MRAIEINSRTNKLGYLKLDYKLDKFDSQVRVLILIDDNPSEIDEEELWLRSISKNSSFDFLNDSSEGIYSLNDVEPFND